jgi:DNA repair protein RadC
MERGWKEMDERKLLTYLLGDERAAGRLLERFGNIKEISKATLPELKGVKGIGKAKAELILSAFELGFRAAFYTDGEKIQLTSPREVANLLFPKMMNLDREMMMVLILNARNRLIRVEEVAVGGLDAASLQPRDIFRTALRSNGAKIILAHNHPSDEPEPSAEDISMTERIAEAGRLLGMPLLDHIIIGDGRYLSLRKREYVR